MKNLACRLNLVLGSSALTFNNPHATWGMLVCTHTPNSGDLVASLSSLVLFDQTAVCQVLTQIWMMRLQKFILMINITLPSQLKTLFCCSSHAQSHLRTCSEEDDLIWYKCVNMVMDWSARPTWTKDSLWLVPLQTKVIICGNGRE